MDWSSLIIQCFDLAEAKSLHVKEIVILCKKHRLVDSSQEPELEKNISSALARMSKGKNKKFEKSRKNGRSKGVYRLFKKPSTHSLKTVDTSDTPDMFTGRAGEHAVMSELLFLGYNASIMTVDMQGVDVIASKDEKYFHLQVKTSNQRSDGSYFATIKREKLISAANTVYVIVLRRKQRGKNGERFINDYVVMPSTEIERWLIQGVIQESRAGGVSFKIEVEKDVFKLNKGLDITSHVNYFAVMK